MIIIDAVVAAFLFGTVIYVLFPHGRLPRRYVPTGSGYQGGKPKRCPEDDILDELGVNHYERTGFWNADGTRYEYVLQDGRTISLRYNEETKELERDW